MALEGIDPGCCSELCSVDAIISVDTRGQMVLPKDLRAKLGIGSGGKLAVITRTKGEKTCCLLLINTNELADQVKSYLGPMFGDQDGKKG